ncbi:MAG: lactate dehydrogenase [Geminicoccaceae bacterium]|nr:MAG: lactate dehydrogenase [Geminicoccaceae bacterium]
MVSGVPRFRPAELEALAERLLLAAGLDAEKAAVTAELLVEADLMGHTTHGLALLAPYLAEIRAGHLACTGEPEVLAEAPAVAVWDGRWLPGLWLTAKAVDATCEKAARFGTAAIAIRRSGHIGCLAVFLRRATERGRVVLVASSDPSVATVAPHGGRRAVFTPDPIAAGLPTPADPVLVDISASITTNAMSARLAREGRKGPAAWWIDAEGRPTDDPRVLEADPPGAILPVGGLDHGHKGTGLALVIEGLTQGLGGFGRADAPTHWGAAVLVQAWDPALFAGLDAFTRQTGWLVERVRATPARPGVEAVRVPGDQAAARRRAALEHGLTLAPGILEALEREARAAGLPLPEPLPG